MSEELNTKQETLLFSISLFFLNPLLGVIFTFNILFSNFSVNKYRLTNYFIVFLSFFLAFINSTKIPENDLLFHASQYLLAKNFTLLEYLNYIKKEPIGYIFNYLFYYLSGGSVKFWIITFSFFSYLLFFKAIKIFFLKIKAPINQLVLGLILAAFFPQLFSLSAHLIRQFIASAIFIYFAVDKIFYKRNKWWLAVIGILTHGSSLILYAFVYFKFLGNFKKYRIINIILIVLLLFYQSIAKLLLNTIGNLNPTIEYILTRASEDTTFDLGNFQMLNYILMFIMIFIALSSKRFVGRQFVKSSKISLNLKEDLYDEKRKDIEKSTKFFFSTMIILSFFILMNLNQSELSNRLFFYLFFYFPFVIPLFIARFKKSVLLSYFFSIALMLFFTYRLIYGVWEYASLYEITTNNLFSYLFRAEPKI